MKRIRAVVEVSVPDKVELSEDEFAKLLRKKLPASVALMPHEMATRQINFKAFYRVVQYGPDGARIAPPQVAKPFEWLVLRALYFIMQCLAGRNKPARQWVKTWVEQARIVSGEVPITAEEPYEIG